MSKAVRYERFGGPEVLEVREIPEPHAAPDGVRVRVAAAGLNPMDWQITTQPDMAARFGITLPAGFGSDFAGVVDEVGPEATGFAVGDRVYGAAIGRSVAEFVLVKTPAADLWHTPEGIADEVAGTLPVASLTAAAAPVLIGGAAGGVGIFAVQLAKRAGARVLGTASEGTFDFLRGLGAEPVAYGPGLADRVRDLAPEGITAAADLFGREAAETALKLGVAPERISVVADGPAPPPGVRKTGAVEAEPGSMERIADAVHSGEITVPIAATFPVDRIHEAVTTQAERHVHGKIVITL
ncbi:NADPH:quinone reductase [Streptomyces varsoviensis]|uniref:NADPH:quinone reductase n=1 Tax=Streptomyces varsoviensis TaxID=67373 RepID=A0ABR5J7S6_9ACTN|nr:NADPH:quinone reductase [Streptomyces varsoviensis]